MVTILARVVENLTIMGGKIDQRQAEREKLGNHLIQTMPLAAMIHNFKHIFGGETQSNNRHCTRDIPHLSSTLQMP
jgi:hypothetical protein